MRILQLAGLAGPDAVAGGVWRVAATQSRLLQEAGHQVTLVGGWWGELPQGKSDADLLLRAREPFPRSGLRTLWVPGMSRSLRAIAGKVDVAHVHLARDFITSPAVHALSRSGVPIVAQTHGMIERRGDTATLIFDAIHRRRILREVKRWLALTNTEKEDLLDWGASGANVGMIRNSVADSGRSWRKPVRPRFAFVSRLHPRKRPDVFVRSVLKLLDAGIDVDAVVAGPDEGSANEVNGLIESSGHARHFEVLGPIDTAAVMSLVAGVTAVVLPSVDEIAPMIALEAASVGTPLVLTSDSGISDAFRNASAAEVVSPEVEPVAAAMRRIVEQGGHAERLGHEARRLFESVWSPGALVRSLESEYGRAMNGSEPVNHQVQGEDTENHGN